MIARQIVETLDDVSRADLESRAAFFTSCIFFSTLAVVLGCALEVPEVVVQRKSRYNTEKIERIVQQISSIGLLLVVLGVAGEMIFENVESQYQGLLLTYNDVLLKAAERQAGSARESAQTAAGASDRARKVSSDASELADKAAGEAKKALSSAQASLRDAETLEHELAAANQQLARQGPRAQLLLTSNSAFRAALTPFAKQKIRIATAEDPSPEISQLYGVLLSDLVRADWVVYTERNFNVRTSLIFVLISDDASDATKRAANALADALRDVGLIEGERGRLVESLGNQTRGDTITLIIGEHL